MSAQTSNLKINSNNITTMNVSQLTPKLGIAFFIIVGISAAAWLWTALLTI